ncbi:TERF1 factor, partial [Psilopogon haemacephalus]|nr:TERF1 factor [Psilopogon haemacephalus]
EAVAADWMLEFACYCLCRHFREGCAAEFQRWRNVAQALINGLSSIPTHQKKMVYLCQLLIRIREGKELEWHFKNEERISGLESALYFWTSLEKEEVKLDKLHEDIHRLLQIQAVAVHMEKGYFKEATKVLERLFADSESDKPLRVKLTTIIKSKDPYVPFLQNFSYNHLISKVKSYIDIFMKDNEANFLIQAATKEVESKGLSATEMQNQTVNVNKSHTNSMETKQRFVLNSICKIIHYFLFCLGLCLLALGFTVFFTKEGCQRTTETWLFRPTDLDNLRGKELQRLAGWLEKQTVWTYKEDLQLKSGVKEFGVGNWAKILVHGNFNNRTSVMLKDRWRTLCRIN